MVAYGVGGELLREADHGGPAWQATLFGAAQIAAQRNRHKAAEIVIEMRAGTWRNPLTSEVWAFNVPAVGLARDRGETDQRRYERRCTLRAYADLE